MENRSREIIDQLDIKKVDIANKLGITPNGLNQILNTKKPKIETIERLAGVINVPAWKLLLSDEEIREIYLLEDVNSSEVNGYIKVKNTIAEVHSFDDLKKIIEKNE